MASDEERCRLWRVKVGGSSPPMMAKILAEKRKAQLITKTTSIMKQRFMNWMAKNNMTFSAICGETFTNREVVYAHIGLVVFLIVVGIAGNF